MNSASYNGELRNSTLKISSLRLTSFTLITPLKLNYKEIDNDNNVRFNAIIRAGRGLLIVALIRSRHFFRSYISSLLKPYRSKSFFMHSTHDFLGRPFFLFAVISTSITSRIWELMSPRMT